MKRVTVLLPGHAPLELLREMLSACGGLLESVPAGVEANLTPTERSLLGYLAARPNQVISRRELLAEVWGQAASVDTRTVDAHVAALRRKLRGTLQVLTVRGRGYQLLG